MELELGLSNHWDSCMRKPHGKTNQQPGQEEESEALDEVEVDEIMKIRQYHCHNRVNKAQEGLGDARRRGQLRSHRRHRSFLSPTPETNTLSEESRHPFTGSHFPVLSKRHLFCILIQGMNMVSSNHRPWASVIL